MLDSKGEELTRRQLYYRVWREPMVIVAKHFGLSDRGLAKICERAGIPVPPRGYWAKKVAGKRVVRPPLLELGGTDNSARFRISPHWKAAEAAESEGQDHNTLDPFEELALRELQDTKPIAVPATLRDPHPIIAKWVKEEWRERESRAWNVYRRSNSNEPSQIERRRRRILSALFKALETRGFKAEQGTYRHDLSIKFERDAVKLELSEHIRYRRVKLTEEEQEQRKTKQLWTQTKERTGELVLRITSGMPVRLASSWRDESEAPLEKKLHLVVVGFVVATAYARKRREEQEEADRRRWREAEEVRKREELRKAELAKKCALRLRVKSWRRAAELRTFVSAVKQAVRAGQLSAQQDQLDQWSTWALSHADELDPITSNRALSVEQEELEDEDETCQ